MSRPPDAVEGTRPPPGAPSSNGGRAFSLAIIDWTQLVEDFLDTIGLSFAEFRDEMSGGWLFGYIDALARAGVRSTLFCVSARVAEVERHVHAATGATICVLPAPSAYRLLRRRIREPHARPPERRPTTARGNAAYLVDGTLRNVAPYLSTPVRALARELKREGCDAILCQDYEHGRFDVCLALGHVLRLPVFATFQGGDRALHPLERPMRGLALRHAAGLVVATGREAERVQRSYGVLSQDVARIFNPLDLAVWRGAERVDERRSARAALGLPDAARVLAWHGRVAMHDKGLDLLLDAWALLCRARPDADLRLILLGTGSDAGALSRRIADPALRGVTWRNEYVRDRSIVRRHLAAADVYALTSRREGFPVAPVEAMACALPVVATDAPGMADILDGGPDVSGGVIVPDFDVARLAHEIGQLLDEPARARALGAVAQARAEASFAPEQVGARLRDFMARRIPARS